MKTNFLKIIFAIAALSWAANYGKAFQNLGFESGTIIPIPGDPYGRVQFGPAMPGWVGYTGNTQETNLLYNGYFLGTAGIGRHDSASLYGTPLQGNYSLLLQAGSNPNGPSTDYVPATIAQTGVVPINSLSVRLVTDFTFLPGTVRVSFGADEIPMYELFGGSGLKTYGGDISSFAGQTGELRISAIPRNVVGQPGAPTWFFLDNIQFSNLPIPEPSAVSLFAVGALILGWRTRRKRNSSDSKFRPLR